MRNYICFLVYYVNVSDNQALQQEKYIIDRFFHFPLLIDSRICRFSNILTFRRVIGMNFHVSHSVHQKRFIRQRPGPFHSSGKVCLGITRVVDTFYLPINPELAIEFSATRVLEKHFGLL